MAKRFTETNKWRDAFFRELSPDAKLTYCYMLDTADNAGVFDPDWRLAAFSIKKDIDFDSVLEELGNRVEKLRNGKIFLTRFIPFQYGGELSPACIPHRNVIELLKKHRIEISHVYRERADEPAPERHADKQDQLPGLEKKKINGRDLLFEALAELNGADLSRLTTAERGRLNKATSEIRKAEPTAGPERVKAAARAWGRKGYSAPATASVLASRWSELTPAPESEESKGSKAEAKERLATARASLKPLMVESESGQDVPRDDLTQEQLRFVRGIKEEIASLTRLLG